jgi:hypothetical protein
MFKNIDFENLPADADAAFMTLVEHFRELLDQSLSGREQEDTRPELRDFMNNVLAAARELGIESFSSWTVPSYADVYSEYGEFDLFLKQYFLRVSIRRIKTAKVFSVSLDQAARERIHGLIAKIRKVIDSVDLEDRKKNSLFAKLNLFEADVDRNRTRFDNAMSFIIEAADAAKKVGESLNPLNEMLKRISEIMGHAKDKEPEDLQLPAPPKKLEPPRKQIEGPKNDDYDDIPF